MDGNFSLVIKEVMIAHQGRYICRVLNYLGILIHNVTDVTIFAPPIEPYPVIDRCPMLSNDTEGACSISTSQNVSITCSASNYFPDIDLFFLLGSQEMDTKDTVESINNDGTKNKSISTLATASETPYVCVASDIPGSQARKTATVLVSRTSTASMTTSYYETTSPSGGGVAKVVIPITSTLFIIILIVVCVVIALWYWKKKRRTPGKDDEEAVPLNSNPHIDGQISFFELWYLVTNMDETALPKLRVALINLGLEIRDEGLTADVAYEVFCSWKDKNKHHKEGKILREKLSKCEIGDSWKNMCERRWDTGTKASEDILEHIVRTIGNEREIAHFLRELIPDHPSNKDGITATEAMKALLRWREGTHNACQVIMLSLALERAQFRPVDREFFKGMLEEGVESGSESPLMCRRSTHRESSILCDRYFSDLAEEIGSEWQRLGIRLGLKQADIDHITEDKLTAVDRILAMLQLWRQRSSGVDKRKMIEELCKALSSCSRTDLAESIIDAAGIK